MVQVETSLLTEECNNWRSALRQYREEFANSKVKLQQAVARPMSKNLLQEVEHLHNQFHIQLINIHDLKQSIKTHTKKIEYEVNVYNGKLNDETLAEHEALLEQYQSLSHTLTGLREQFNSFLEKAT